MIDSEKPKYQKLKEYLIETIKLDELKTGEKIYSENELSVMFDISRHTVRQSIGELVTEGWLYRVQGKGTFVNRRPNGKISETKTIGVITTYLSDYIFPAIIRGINSILSINGYSIALGCTYNQHDKERICLESFINQKVDGLIVEGTRSALPNPNIDLYRQLSNSGIPILFMHGCYKELDYSYIVEDDVQAGYIATKHLISLGHNKIGGIFKMDDIQGHFRFSGFQKAHLKAGIEFSDSRILWFNTDEIDKKLKSEESSIFETLLSKCTAIVCYNEQIALKVINVIRENDLNVPGDISVVSFDDSQLAMTSEIKLTTVAHPKEKLGEEAAKAMISMIGRIKDYHDIKIQPKLIVRDSAKKIMKGLLNNE